MRITCDVMGGLGNQLFQIATVLAVAWRQNLVPIFTGKEIITLGGNCTPRPNYWKSLFRTLTLTKENLNFPVLYEDWNQTFIKFPEFKTDIKLYGHFQTSKYFHDYRAKILDTFKLDTKDSAYVENFFLGLRNKYPNRPLVSLHVRRTDYITINEALSQKYFLDASKHFPTDTVFVIFSDDQAWCRNNLSTLASVEYVSEKDYLELFIMSKCDGHIMSNSSFSWWGCYLGDRYGTKRVVAPKPWFRGAPNGCLGIFESYWTILPNN